MGKSTIAANLALAFSSLGYKSGILDTDLFGPSIPTLFNLADGNNNPLLTDKNQLVPLTNYGVKTMSMGYLVGEESAPLVWRGPMLLKAVQQLLHEVDWAASSSSSSGSGLDVLVLDLPPGTGDIQLSITQQVELSGAVIVTTPHTLAIKDAVKGVNMFNKVGVPLLGVVNNMSVYTCPCCGEKSEVFGSSEGVRKKVCQEYGMDYLGDVPLHGRIGEDGSEGRPTVVSEPDSERAEVFRGIARLVAGRIGLEQKKAE